MLRNLLVILLMFVPLLVMGVGVVAQDDPPPEGPRLTWDNAPQTPPMRHRGDERVRLGWEPRAKALGPFMQPPFEVGDETTFSITSAEDTSTFVLRHRSEHAYFWFEPNATIDNAALLEAAHHFDTAIWPTNRDVFGENATPGVDGDARIHLVHLNSLYPGLAGFFFPEDQCARYICSRSNERDVLYLILDYGPLNSDLYLSTIAHEFQHMISYAVDGNEYRWLDEGLSQLAEYINGFDADPINATNLSVFLQNPNQALNGWSNEFNQQSGHYGASYAFVVYLYERFGTDFIRALTRSPFDGLAAVHFTLKNSAFGVTLDEAIADWWIANRISNFQSQQPQWHYPTFALPNPAATVQVGFPDGEFESTGTLHQYGARYFQLDAPGTYEIEFSGDVEQYMVNDLVARSGNGAWWSYNASYSATTLTRTIDLSEVDAATLKFWIGGDTGGATGHLHVLVSRDGRQWTVLRGLNSELFNRVSDAPGPHYNTTDGQWMADFIDLTEYAGDIVQLRFEYVTNNSVTGPGFLIDDVGIPEIAWSDTMDTPDDEWIAEGFVHTSGLVDQRWVLAAINNSNNPTVDIQWVDNGQATMQVVVDSHPVTILLGAQAPLTQMDARYTLSIELD